MGRKKKKRFVQGMPDAVFFKPQGIPLKELTRQPLSLEGFEAIRLVDGGGLMQQEAADQMGVSRPTLSRILSKARNDVAMALTNGWAIEIDGGAYMLANDEREQLSTQGDAIMRGRNRGGAMGAGQGMGRGQGRGAGQGQCRNAGQGMGQGQGQGMGQGNRQRNRTPGSGFTQGTPNGPIKTVAVSSEGPSLDDQVDPRFGRAGGFVIVDLSTMESTYMDNGASQVMNQGAGIQAAESVANSNADAVLTGYVGPKAFAALSAAGIHVGQDVENMTVRQAVDKFMAGEVNMASEPNGREGANK